MHLVLILAQGAECPLNVARSALRQETLRTVGGMNKRTIAIAVLGVAVLLGAGAAARADSQDTPITGSAYDRAAAVALAQTGGGKITGTEVNDEESYYQVEVTKADGTQVDVNLDRAFNVVKTKAESAGS